MKRFLVLAVFLAGAQVFAAPFVRTDPVPANITHCGFFTDAGAVVVLPKVGNICEQDVASIAVGSHVVQVDMRMVNDPIWGTLTSAKSTALNFTRPGPPSAPTNPVLAP